MRRPALVNFSIGIAKLTSALSCVDKLDEPLDLLLEELLRLTRLCSFFVFARPLALTGARGRRVLHLEVGEPPSVQWKIDPGFQIEEAKGKKIDLKQAL